MSISPASNSGKKDLSDRLGAIARAIPKGSLVCDIGSDHGLLPLFLVKHGICPQVLVTDLNAFPLERAKSAFAKNALSDRARFLQCNGIAEPLAFRPDLFVIAGMSGKTIVQILAEAEGKIPVGTRFFLQPMTKDAALRRYLYAAGFAIQNETVVLENRKVFLILDAVFDGISRTANEAVLAFGETKFACPERAAYYKKKKESLEIQIRGKESAGQSVLHEKHLLETLCGVLGGLNYENQ